MVWQLVCRKYREMALRERQVTADGIYVTGHGLVVDEASLTGESEPLRKNEERPFIRCGTQVPLPRDMVENAHSLHNIGDAKFRMF